MLQFVLTNIAMISLGTILYLGARTLPRIDGEPETKENILDRLANSGIPEKVDNVLNSFLSKFLRRLKILLMKVDNFVSEKLKKISRKINFGAQDAFWGNIGAFTGEVSAEMLYNAGIKYVILGHSERRALGETNALVNKKIKASLSAGLVPILCVGENIRDASHSYFNLVKTQLEECLDGIKKTLTSKIIVA